jgi:ligand-binding sensor domain-containing protein
MKKHILLFILLNAFFLVEAKYYDLVNITNNDGLSNSSVTTIFQNSSGLMWFGTWDGLNAYNGREFKVYKPEPGNSQSICNNIIRDIIEEDEETQWCLRFQAVPNLLESPVAYRLTRILSLPDNPWE